MTATSSADLDQLRSAVKGEVHGPNDSGYDEARTHLERADRPAAGGGRDGHQHRRRGRGDRVRARERPRDLGARRRAQHRRLRGRRRRADDRPRADERASRSTSRTSARRSAAGRCSADLDARDAGPRAGDARRHGQPHRRRRADPRRRHGLADPAARAGHRQPDSAPRSSSPTAASCGRAPTSTRTCSGRCAAAAATSASSPRSSSRLHPVGPMVYVGAVLLEARPRRRGTADAARRGRPDLPQELQRPDRAC